MILFAFSAIGCISDGGSETEDWNSLVMKVNESLEEGNGHDMDINSHIEDLDYEKALASIDEALECYDKALFDIARLKEYAKRMEEEYLTGYVIAWEGQVQEIANSLRCLRVIISIDMFNVEFYNVSSLHPVAEQQMSQAFNYYYKGEHEAAVTSATSSLNKYETMEGVANDLKSISVGIGEPFVIDYANGIADLVGHASSALDHLKMAANSAMQGDESASGQLISTANEDYGDYIATIDLLIGIETMHPNAFPSQGFALQELRATYLAIKSNSESSALGYRERMRQLEEEHQEFFE